jgi:hypothetical protein
MTKQTATSLTLHGVNLLRDGSLANTLGQLETKLLFAGTNPREARAACAVAHSHAFVPMDRG